MPNTFSRVVGSGYTYFLWQGNPIALIDEIQDSGQQPIAQYQAVTPLGSNHPLEFALPRVRSEGTLQITLRELWNFPSWWALGQRAQQTGAPASSNGVATVPHRSGASSLFAGTQNIIEIYNAQSQSATPIVCQTIILVPGASSDANIDPTSPVGKNYSYRGWTYHGVVLTAIDDSETVQIGDITVPRTLTAVYTYKTYFPGASGAGSLPTGVAPVTIPSV
jgi:hypothetical protein